MRNRAALLAALGVDNFGSGMFLPLSLVYATRVVGLSLGVAGTLVALGTAAGLAAPALAGRLVDRFGPKPVFIGAELLQALGALAYLLARGAPPVVVAAMLLAAGQQAFYSSLFALISDVTGTGPRDRPFTVANMVRSACFGLGGLAAAGLLTTAGPAGLRAAVAGDAASFVACAVMLALLVRVGRPQPSGRVAPRDAASRPAPQRPGRFRVLADRPFLGLIAVMGLVEYAFTAAGLVVPAVVALYSVAAWLPWILGAVSASAAILGLRRLASPCQPPR